MARRAASRTLDMNPLFPAATHPHQTSSGARCAFATSGLIFNSIPWFILGRQASVRDDGPFMDYNVLPRGHIHASSWTRKVRYRRGSVHRSDGPKRAGRTVRRGPDVIQVRLI